MPFDLLLEYGPEVTGGGGGGPHTHVIADVTGLQAALDGKAAVSHAHTIANVTGLQAALDAKAASVHSHAIADTTGLQAALDAKAASVHSHAIADTTGLQAALDGKETSGAAAAAIAAHLAAGDPHAQYLTAAEGNAAYSALGHGHADATTGVAGFMSAADKTKLNGIATGATANSSDATLLNRANHTGTQPAATISDFSTAADARIGAASINALADVVITTLSTGQVLKYNGSNWINDTDNVGGGGSVTMSQIEVDFGAQGSREKFFTVALAGTLSGQKVLASVSLIMPAGVSEDELEMDPLVVAGRVPANDQVRLLVASARGSLISGKRNINVVIG